MLLDSFHCQKWGVDAPSIQWADTRDTSKYPAYTGQSQQQSIIWSKRSVVPLFKNSGLN